jgi:hypothetical protein
VTCTLSRWSCVSACSKWFYYFGHLCILKKHVCAFVCLSIGTLQVGGGVLEAKKMLFSGPDLRGAAGGGCPGAPNRTEIESTDFIQTGKVKVKFSLCIT